MKKFHKLLALLMALAMSMMVFAACGSDDDDEDDKSDKKKVEETVDGKKSKNSKTVTADDDEAEVEATVTAFMDAYTTLDFAKALNYIDADSDAFDSFISSFDLDASDIDRNFDFREYFYESMGELMDELEAYGLGFMEDSVNDFVDGCLDMMISKFSYKIKDVKVNGDKATAKISVTLPDMESIDFDDIAENAMGDLDIDEDAIQTEFMEYAMNKLGTDDISDLQYLSQEDAINLLFGYLEDSGLVSEIFDYMLEQAKDQLDTETEESTLMLELIGGDWLIVDNK